MHLCVAREPELGPVVLAPEHTEVAEKVLLFSCWSQAKAGGFSSPGTAVLKPRHPPSIVGLYVLVVMVAAKFIRDRFLSIAYSIMYDQLPDVDLMLGLCMDIFLVRELGELQLEQELFSRLTFLYRSPETMIKWRCQRPPTPCLPPADPVAGASVECLEAAVVSSSPLASEK